MKKKLLLVIFIFGVINCFVPQVRAETWNVRFEITGTTSLSFRIVFRDDSGYHEYSDDAIPKNYTGSISFGLVTGTASKKEDSGMLIIILYVNGILRDNKSTSASFGAASVSYNPTLDTPTPIIPGFELLFVIIGLVSIIILFYVKNIHEQEKIKKIRLS